VVNAHFFLGLLCFGKESDLLEKNH